MQNKKYLIPVLADYNTDLPRDRDEETSFSLFLFFSSSLPLQHSLPFSAAPLSCPLIPEPAGNATIT